MQHSLIVDTRYRLYLPTPGGRTDTLLRQHLQDVATYRDRQTAFIKERVPGALDAYTLRAGDLGYRVVMPATVAIGRGHALHPRPSAVYMEGTHYRVNPRTTAGKKLLAALGDEFPRGHLNSTRDLFEALAPGQNVRGLITTIHGRAYLQVPVASDWAPYDAQHVLWTDAVRHLQEGAA